MTNLSTFITYDADFPLLMPKWGYVASAFVLFLIGFFGFFLNLMVILLMIKDRQLWTPLNMILFNLVCSDFCVSIMGNPLTLISALFHQWVFGKTMCMLYGFFMALLGISSITSLTVLSFERYMMVTRPLSARHRSTGGSCLIIICIWTYSLLLTTPPLFGWGNYVNEAANISCSVNWHEQSTNTLTYILFLFAFGQVIPFAVISFSYINILRTIRKNSKRMGQVGRAETKVTVMVLIMIVAFVVAWTPYSVFALMEQFAAKDIISPGLGVVPALVAKSSICYDPLIYIGMNTQFRQSIRKLFGGKSKGNVSQTEKVMDNTISPAHRGKKQARRNSADNNLSTITKKHINILDKKVSMTDLPSTTVEEYNSPFIKNVAKTTRLHQGADKALESTSGRNRGGNLCDVTYDGSPVLTMIDPECLSLKNDISSFTNKGFELTLETVSKNQMFEENYRAASNLVHSRSCELAEESFIETSSESTYTRHYSFRNRLTGLTKNEDKDNIIL